MPRFRGGMRGGADCARARISPDGVRIRQAVACRLFAARTRAALSDGWHRPARAGPCVDDAGTPEPRRLNAMPSPHPHGGPPQARFHPHPDCRPALAGTRGKDFSGGWLGRSARRDVPRGHPVQADPAASGTRRCTASSFVPPHVTASPRRPSSRLDRYVSGPSGDRSAGMMAWGLGAGKRLSGILAIQLESLRREPGSVNAKTAFSQNPISPLAGEMSAKQTEGGIVQPVSNARNLGKAHPPLSPTVTSPPQGGRLGGCPDRLGCQQNGPDRVSTFRYRQSPSPEKSTTWR
jgi:hypothetical protein